MLPLISHPSPVCCLCAVHLDGCAITQRNVLAPLGRKEKVGYDAMRGEQVQEQFQERNEFSAVKLVSTFYGTSVPALPSFQ